MEPAPAPFAISPDQPVPAEFDLLCENCGYSLVGLMSDRCPECGQPFDPAQLPLARVPWLYRKRLGKLSAHLQTTCLIILHPRVFARELCRPVRICASDAHAFRLRTIRITAIALIVPFMAGIYLQMPTGLPRGVWPALALVCALGWIATCVWLRLATDLPTFIWRGLPGKSDDLSPLHHYAAAPLALLLIPALLATAGVFLLDHHVFNASGQLAPVAWLAIALLLLPVAVLVWTIPLVIMKTATGCSPRRVWGLAGYLPLHWLIMTVLIVLAVSAIAFWVIMR